MNNSKSIDAFLKAQKLIPGGVNSPVRAFKSVGTNPLFIASAKGAHIYDIDGNDYIDYVCSWGPLILGHAPQAIVEAVSVAAQKGTSFGAPSEIETEVAEMIVDRMPAIEKVRMVNSGTEATMSAVRLARGFTGKEKIIKFAGCFHGHADSFLIKAGSGLMTFGLPDSAGVPASVAQNTLVAEYNDLDSVSELFRENAGQIAAVIVEPVAGNMGCVIPEPGFLKGLRDMTTANEALLIFDEVITGFRVAKGGAQELFNIMPDITTLGKIIGGGLPVGAYGGKKEIMDYLAPLGPVYQSGTLAGNPLAMAAGKAMLIETAKPGFYEKLEKLSEIMEQGLRKASEETGIHTVINRTGAMLTMFFNEKEKVINNDTAMESDKEMFAEYFRCLLKKGIYTAPSQFECMFISSAHTEQDVIKTLEMGREALYEVKKNK